MEANQQPLVERVVRRLGNLVEDTVGRANYRVRQLGHAPHLPPLGVVAQRVVNDVNEQGISVLPLGDLPCPSNASLLEVLPRVNADMDALPTDGSHLIEYPSGFDHCVPLNPTDIARAYPALYLWGLDERILDIIENCIGLPIAYHGVIARKEVVDGEFRGTRNWHRDMEDRNIIRISIYLSDVLDADGGPFEYIPKPLTPPDRAFVGHEGRISDDVMRKIVPESAWKRCVGPAGTVIFGAVAKVYHHGKMPKRPRKAISYYYTTREPTNEVLCREYSFQRGVPYIDGSHLSPRQMDVLWHYRQLIHS